MSLLTELDAFFTEHPPLRRPGRRRRGAVVWIVCDCGASMARRADERDALVSDA